MRLRSRVVVLLAVVSASGGGALAQTGVAPNCVGATANGDKPSTGRSAPVPHWLFIAPLFGGITGCGQGGFNHYLAILDFDGCSCYGGDCNHNGVDDARDIAAGTSLDCFDYAAASGTRGGANGIPDDCECIADWNRDGIANSTDVSDFINTWFAAQAGQLPYAGCTI